MKWLYKKAFEYVLNQHHRWLLTKGKKGIRLTFENRHIPETLFYRTEMKRCQFNHADVNNSNFFSADLASCSFEHATFSRSQFDAANFYKCDLSKTNLRQATHQVHIRNRQKEDVIRIFDAVDGMEDGINKEIISKFLRTHEIQRPRLQ